jgi:hypothetical protein
MKSASRRDLVYCCAYLMTDPALTPSQLESLLATLLTGAAGADEAHWRGMLKIERTSIIDDIRTNWRLVATGSRRDRKAIDSAADIVRGAHPYVAW